MSNDLLPGHRSCAIDVRTGSAVAGVTCPFFIHVSVFLSLRFQDRKMKKYAFFEVADNLNIKDLLFVSF